MAKLAAKALVGKGEETVNDVRSAAEEKRRAVELKAQRARERAEAFSKEAKAKMGRS